MVQNPNYNPALKKLGFAENDRVVVIHADDVGVSQASIDAYLELMDFGTITCGSAMTPSSWFPCLARIVTENPKLDMGLHLPVTSEYQDYRWRPVSRVDRESGLVDDFGYFHARPATTGARARVESVIREYEAQIQLSLKLGLIPTHLDNHHALPFLFPQFLRPFLSLAMRYHIMPVIMRVSTMAVPAMPAPLPGQPASNPMGGIDSADVMAAAQTVADVADAAIHKGLPVPDYFAMMPVNFEGDRLAYTKRLISDIQPGLTHFAIHPTKDTPETRAITPTWPSRVGDYQVFMSPEIKDHLRHEGIHLIGYKALASQMPE